jgi:hypothetical protein
MLLFILLTKNIKKQQIKVKKNVKEGINQDMALHNLPKT